VARVDLVETLLVHDTIRSDYGSARAVDTHGRAPGVKLRRGHSEHVANLFASSVDIIDPVEAWRDGGGVPLQLGLVECLSRREHGEKNERLYKRHDDGSPTKPSRA